MKKDRDYWIKEYGDAHCDFNIFEAIVAILEGGTVSASVQPDGFRIIHICQAAQSKCLRRMDRARAKAGGKIMD